MRMFGLACCASGGAGSFRFNRVMMHRCVFERRQLRDLTAAQVQLLCVGQNELHQRMTAAGCLRGGITICGGGLSARGKSQQRHAGDEKTDTHVFHEDFPHTECRNYPQRHFLFAILTSLRPVIGSRVSKELRQRKMPGSRGFFAVAFNTREPIRNIVVFGSCGLNASAKKPLLRYNAPSMSEKKPKPLLAKPARVKCLRCERKFASPDRRRIRLCGRCKQRKR